MTDDAVSKVLVYVVVRYCMYEGTYRKYYNKPLMLILSLAMDQKSSSRSGLIGGFTVRRGILCSIVSQEYGLPLNFHFVVYILEKFHCRSTLVVGPKIVRLKH